MQSVSQYDTAERSSSIPAAAASVAGSASRFNHDFWAFTPANPSSSYLNHYHVRFGPAENPAATVRGDGFFVVHYLPMAAELWLDSTQGWLAVVDGATRYAMVERFRYEDGKPYPGKASVIFWSNGPEVRVSSDGVLTLGADSESRLYYLEADIMSDAGILIRPLQANALGNGKVRLSGSFGVFFSGRLVARFYDERGHSLGTLSIADVNPAEPVSLETEIVPQENPRDSHFTWKTTTASTAVRFRKYMS